MSHFSLFLQELFNRRPAEMQPPGKSKKESKPRRDQHVCRCSCQGFRYDGMLWLRG